jgi:hypothetical protein
MNRSYVDGPFAPDDSETLAAAAMALSSVSVIDNSLRLRATRL